MTYQKILEKIYREFLRHHNAHDSHSYLIPKTLSYTNSFDMMLKRNEILEKFNDCKLMIYFDSRPMTFESRKQIKDLISLVREFNRLAIINLLSREKHPHEL